MTCVVGIAHDSRSVQSTSLACRQQGSGLLQASPADAACAGFLAAIVAVHRAVVVEAAARNRDAHDAALALAGTVHGNHLPSSFQGGPQLRNRQLLQLPGLQR